MYNRFSFKILFVALVTIVTFAQLDAQTQRGVVKKVSHSAKSTTTLSDVLIAIDKRNVVKSDENGEFAVDMHGLSEGDGYILKDVKKTGYALLNTGDLGEHPFSTAVELPIYMYSIREKMQEQEALYQRWKKSLDVRIRQIKDSLMTELEEARIENHRFEEELYDLEQYYSKNQNLLKNLSEHYALLNYEEMSEWEIQLAEFVEQGLFEQADSLINLRGINNLINDAKTAQKNAKVAKNIYSNAQKEAEHKTQEAIQALFAKHAAAVTQADQYAAVGYMQQIVSLDSTNIEYLRILASDLCNIGEYDLALAVIQQAEIIAAEKSSRPLLAIAIIEEGIIDLYKTGDGVRKAEITKQVFSLYSEEDESNLNYEDSVVLTLFCAEMANAYSACGDYSKANFFISMIPEIVPQIHNNETDGTNSTTISFNSIVASYALSLLSRGAYKDLLSTLDSIPQDSTPSAIDAFYAEAYCNIYKKGKEAIYHAKRFQQYINTEAQNNVDARFNTYYLLSKAYLSDSNYIEAQQYLDTLRTLYQSCENPNIVNYLRLLNQTGVMYYYHTNEYEKAIPLFQEALQIMDSTRFYNQSLRSMLLYNIAQNYLELDELDSARHYHNQALEIRWEQSPFEDTDTYSHALAESYAGYGKLNAKQNDFMQAHLFYKKAFATQYQVSNENSAWSSYLAWAHYYLQKAKKDSTINRTKKFKKYYKQYHDAHNYMFISKEGEGYFILEVDGQRYDYGKDDVDINKSLVQNKAALVYRHGDFYEMPLAKFLHYTIAYFPVGKENKKNLLKAYKKYKKEQKKNG